ncbi:hypothetical protein GCM10009804_70130 [Kribbella hippodromi]|uniref:Uncharacterized protein n=1 Tax=Kribbella hippodromi TaxID=434347 RepID=A0ABP4QDA9_9ACTN
MKTYELRIQGFSGTGEALEMQEPVARVLCPVEAHNGPCDVPWGFTLADESHDLLLGIYATPEKAAEVAEKVRAVVGGRTVLLAEGDPSRFEELIEQYQIEHPNG